MENDIPLEGTFFLDGMLQGKVAAGVAELAHDWVESAKRSGFEFSYEGDGGQFSLLCGDDVRKLPDNVALAETLAASLNALIEKFPEETRQSLFSTIRSTEFSQNTKIEGLFLAGQNGEVKVQTRKSDCKTRQAEAPATTGDIIKRFLIAGVILAVFIGISAFLVDYRKLFANTKDRVTIMSLEEIDFDPSLYAKYVTVKPVKLDRRNSGIRFTISRGPDWSEVEKATFQLNPEKEIVWDDFLVQSNLKRGAIPCRIYGREKGVAMVSQIPVSALELTEKAEVFLSLPGNTRVKQIVLSR